MSAMMLINIPDSSLPDTSCMCLCGHSYQYSYPRPFSTLHLRNYKGMLHGEDSASQFLAQTQELCSMYGNPFFLCHFIYVPLATASLSRTVSDQFVNSTFIGCLQDAGLNPIVPGEGLYPYAAAPFNLRCAGSSNYPYRSRSLF